MAPAAPGVAVPDQVPAPAAAAPASPASGPYRVMAGDTLWDLALRNGVTVSSLAAANGILDPDLILVGQQLSLPGSAAVPSRRTGPTSPAHGSRYQVRPGDTLAGIASKLGVSGAAFAAANGIVDGRLFSGALLRVPGPGGTANPFVAGGGTVHTVTPGETLAGVAARFHVSAQALAAANGLAPGAALRRGTQLAVPSAWRCPVTGPVSFMNDWGFIREGGSPHQGNDLFAPRGTPVVAPVGGVVSKDPNHLGGNAFSLVGNDGNRYYGAHLARYGAVGRVSAGTVIGYVGDSGDAAGGPTHLHFEIHPGGGDSVNPYPTLRRACGS
jgi:LysM repeat protein